MTITKEQLAVRHLSIGSSDAAGVLGVSRYSTPLKVWAEKTGAVKKEEYDSLAIELGNRLEGVVADLFTKKTGIPTKIPMFSFRHEKYEFITANIDRIIDNPENPDQNFHILEIKTTGEFNKKQWEGDEIPQEYIVQVLHQMAVTGCTKAYIAVLIGNRDLKIKEILRDEKVIEGIVLREVDFWNNYVTPKIPPKEISSLDTDTINSLFPQAHIPATVLNLHDHADYMIKELDSYDRDIKNLEGKCEGLKNQLKMLLGDSIEGVTPNGNTIKWTNSKYSSLDSKAIKEAHPELFAKFYVSKLTRRFDWKIKEDK